MKQTKITLKDAIRKDAYLWLGKTNIDNTYLMLVNFNNNLHYIVVEDNEDNITLKAPKETNALKVEIFDMLYEVKPAWKKKEQGSINTSTLPKMLEITGDLNNDMFTKDIKVLKQTTVITYLDSLGVNITKYDYTTIKVDNSHTVVTNEITKGYSNYDPECIAHMTDVSEYKGYKCAHPEIVDQVMTGLTKNLLLVGPAGTGKTTEFKIACANNEVPIFVTQFTSTSDDSDIISSFVPNTSEDGGTFVLKRGPLTYPVQYGGIGVGDEINFASPNFLSCLNSLLDDTGTVMLEDGTVLHKHKDFRFIATMNPGYAGTSKMNPAFVNRFDVFYYPDVAKKEFISRLKKETGYKNDKVLDVLYEQFKKLKDIYKSKNLETELTFRNILSFLKKMLANPTGDLETYFRMSCIDCLTINDLVDAESELEEYEKYASTMVAEIKSAFQDNSEEVKEASWSCQPSLDLDDLTAGIEPNGLVEAEEEE